jgi:glucose dehydrogenase
LSSTDVNTPTTRREASGLRRAFQVLAGLAVVNVLVQFITAGQLFPNGGPQEVHAGGAIVLHVLSGLAAVTAVLLWRQQRLGLRSTVLAVVVFAYTFLQAYWGGYSTLWIHVPGAMLLTVGVVWVFFTSLRTGTR